MPDGGPDYVSLDGNPTSPWYRRLVQKTKSTDRKMVFLIIMGLVIIGLLGYIIVSNNNCPQPVVPETTVIPTISSTTQSPTTPTTMTTTPTTTPLPTTSTPTPTSTTSQKPSTSSVKPPVNDSQPVTI